MQIAGSRIAVAGLGQSGLAVAEFLLAKGARVRVVDSRPLAELKEIGRAIERLGVPFALQSPEAFEGVDAIVISPGVPADLEELEAARRRGVPVLGEVELASEFLAGPIIGITGANGKTTTTALTGHILREAGIPAQVGGNIGAPVTGMIAASRPDQWNVLELSSFQLETIQRFRAQVAVCLNVTPDHLDRHHTFENYANAKARLFETQGAGDFAVLNADDATCLEFGRRTRARTLWFSITRAVGGGLWADQARLYFEGAPFLEIAGIPLRGRHNVENVMGAILVGLAAGLERDAIVAAVREFKALHHRLEPAGTHKGVEYFDDSKATNPGSVIAALRSFERPIVLIAGGKAKGTDFAEMGRVVSSRAKAVVLIGEAADEIARTIKRASVHRAGSMQEAVRIAASLAVPGDVVLLSPGCASFDMFQSAEDRGEQFTAAVAGLDGSPLPEHAR